MLKAQKNIYYTISENEQFILSKLSFHSARLYNSCVYDIRQYFFSNNAYLPFKEQYHQIKDNENFKLLINDSAQQVLRIVDKEFRSFFSLLKLKAKGKYSAPVGLPRYLKKDDGWHIFIAGRSCRVKGDSIYIGISKLFRETYGIEQRDIKLPLPKNIGNKKIHQVQITPNKDNSWSYITVYEDEVKTVKGLRKDKELSIDVGTNNLFTCYDSFNNKAFIIDGRYIKSVNQFFNKKLGKLQSKYENTDVKWNKTKKFFNISNRRNNKINECFNLAVKKLIDYCLKYGIGKIIIGDFSESKNGSQMNTVANQNFIQIPHYKLKMKLQSKCEEYGIEYILTEESYTSKACAYNLDLIPTYSEDEESKGYAFSGYRETRGMYKVKGEKIRYNADVNGAINILRKYRINVSKEGDLSLELVRAVSTSHPNLIRLMDNQATKSLA